MLKFSSGKKVWPAVRVVGAEDMKISLYFLVGSLCLSISLGMVSSGESDIVFEKSCQFSGESQGKLGSLVRYNGVVETESFEYVVEKEFSHSCSIDGF